MACAYSGVVDIEADSREIGMFLLARLIMDNLLGQDCYEDLEEELNGEVLPNGIDQASVPFLRADRSCAEAPRYARILDRMQKKNQSKRRWDPRKSWPGHPDNGCAAIEGPRDTRSSINSS